MTRGWDKKMQRRQDKINRKEQNKYNRYLDRQKKENQGRGLHKTPEGWAIGNIISIKKKSLIAIIIIVSIILIVWGSTFYPWPEANGETLKTMMSITRSKSCESVYHDTGGCIDNRYLVQSYDNTNTAWSGTFDEVNGDLKRGSPQYKNHWMLYQSAEIKTIVAVDPDGEWVRKAATRQIIIEPNNFTFIDKGSKNTNSSFTFYDKIYISGCNRARVAADKDLIQKVVLYFYGNCEGKKPSSTTTVIIPPTPIKLMDYKEYKYKKWLSDIKEKCKQRCSEYPISSKLKSPFISNPIPTQPKDYTAPKNYTVNLRG